MRTEKEMFDLICKTALEDARVRAVYMNGSRANPAVERDDYQDYDIVYVVTETASFLSDRNWITIFGDIAMVQEPDANDLGWGQQADYSRSYGWLVLFMDGTRIDLHIQTVEAMKEEFGQDSLTAALLDKDKILPPIPAANDSSYWIQRPEKSTYAGCCNEFWWCLNNVAKGIARDQLPYAMHMYFETVHKELDKMLEWYIGLNHGFCISPGMWGKYFKKLLPEDCYQMYQATFSDAQYDNIWKAVFASVRLFRLAAMEVGRVFDYSYPEEDDRNMTLYLEKSRVE